MMVVRVEVWPGGDESRARQVATAQIHNDTGLVPVSGDSVYGYRLAWDGPDGPVLIEGGQVPHRRRDSPWHLLRSVLRDALG